MYNIVFLSVYHFEFAQWEFIQKLILSSKGVME